MVLVMLVLYVLSFLAIGFWVAQKALVRNLFPKEFLYIASIAASLCIYYFLFYLYVLSPTVAHVALIFLIFMSLLCGYFIVKGFCNSESSRITARKYYLPPAIITIIVLFAYSLNFYSCLTTKPSIGGYQETTNPPFCSISGLPFDNALPYIYGNNILNKQEKQPVIDWTLADRPPLQIAASLPILDFAKHSGLFKKFAYYNVFAMFLQLSWVGAIWSTLKFMKVDKRYIPFVLVGLATVGFFYLNSVFVWPKLLAGAMVVSGVIIFVGKRAIDYRYLPYAAILLSLGLLSHDGVIFTIFPFTILMLYKIYRAREIKIQYLLYAIGLALVLLAPWSIYKGTITKNDRLTKWHLAGIHSVEDKRSTFQAITQQYSKLSLKQWANDKKINAETLVTGNFHISTGCRLNTIGIVNKCIYSNWRGLTFFSTLFALESFNLGWFILIYRAAKHRLQNTDIELMLLIAASLAVWVLAMFEPGATIVHQGSYATMMLIFILLIRSLVTLPVRFFAALVAIQTIIFYLVWVSGFYKLA